MWKTFCFQQLFFPSGELRSLWESLWTMWTIARLSTGTPWLRHRSPSKKSRRKWACRLAFVTFSGKSDGGRNRPPPTNFVKNRQSPILFSLFRPVYQFPGLGNNDGVSFQTGGTYHAGKSGNLRGEHIPPAATVRRRDGRAAAPDQAGGQSRPGTAHRGKPAAGSQRHPAF